LDNFVKLYSPSFYSRLGLRYRDVIRRSILNLIDVNWSDLLQPSIIGLLGNKDLEGQIEDFVSNTVLDLGELYSKVRIQTGFITIGNLEEKGYFIDSDFHTNEKTAINDSIYTLEYYNECSSRLIRWCITEKLHNAMEPKEL